MNQLLPDGLVLTFAFVFGAIFGSFASVVAGRFPVRESDDETRRKGARNVVPAIQKMSELWALLGGRSRCPRCGAQLSALENVPIIGYVRLRGRCRHCGNRISVRYPALELVTGALFVLSLARFEISFRAALYCFLFWVLVVLSAIDIDHHLLPNALVYPAVIAAASGVVVDALLEDAPGRLLSAGYGVLIFAGFLFVLAFVYPAGMGFGDVKLAVLLGMLLGYAGGAGVVPVGMFMAFLAGSIGGVVEGVVRRYSARRRGEAAAPKLRKTQVPFGPYLMAGTIAAIAWGDRLLDWYLGLA